MALIDDQHVKEFGGEYIVVRYRDGRLTERSGAFEAGTLLIFVRQFGLASEHRIHALDRRDDDPIDGVEVIALGKGDVVELIERVPFARRLKLLEFLKRLDAEIRAIDQETNSAGVAVLDEPIGDIGGGKGFARTGG